MNYLESESIHIFREVVSEAKNPVFLYSIGKDSSVMLHLAMKAFYPAIPPFKFLHIDTTWKFKEMIKFRDETMKKFGFDLIVHINKEGIEKKISPITHGSEIHTYTNLTLLLAVLEGMKKNLDQKKEFFLLDQSHMHGTQKTKDQSCGVYIT